MLHLYPLLALHTAHVWAGRGELDRAVVVFERAAAEALGLGILPIIWQARGGAAQSLAALGHNSEAVAKRQEAREIVGEIADRFRDPALRDRYLTSVQTKIG